MRVLMKILFAVLSLLTIVVIGSYLFVRMVNPENYYARAEGWIEENYEVTVRFDGDSELSWSGLTPSLQIEKVTYGDPVEITGHAVRVAFTDVLQIRKDIQQGRRFDVDVKADRIALDTVSFENVILPLQVGDVIETTSPFSAKLFNGDLSGNFTIDGNRLSFNGDLENVDVSQFVSSFVFGVNGAADLNGELGSDFLESLQGEVIMRSHGGSLTGNAIDRWAGDVLLNLLPGEREATELECMTAPFKVQNGVARTDTVIINTDTVVIVGAGRVNLAGGTLDFEFDPKPRDPSLISLATPINVSGDIADPAVSVTQMGVLKKLGGLIAGAVNPIAFLLTFSTLGAAPEDEECFQSARTILEQ